jgi:hypothetical protein
VNDVSSFDINQLARADDDKFLRSRRSEEKEDQ